MKKLFLLLFSICVQLIFAQDTDKLDNATIESLKKNLLKNTSEKCCKCIDSISTIKKTKEDISYEINKCIDNRINLYNLSSKLLEINTDKDSISDKKKVINVSYNIDKNSNEYKTYYYEIERYLMENCKAIKSKIASNEISSGKSFSKNERAIEQYNLGIEASKKENYEEAIKYYKKAVEIDSEFAFAYDNLGISYRKIGKYNEAIEAYKNSSRIDPYSVTPLQNIAIAYQYVKEYEKSIEAYKKLAELDSENPEVFYGIGHVYSTYLNEHEKALDYMCKAYNLYVSQNSPYRSDAEKIIQYIYVEMNKEGKKDKFIEILEANKIRAN